MQTLPAKRRWTAIPVALVVLFFQLIMWPAVFGILGEWRAVGVAYAGVGIIWALAAAAMLVAALWVFVTLGRHRLPLWIAGIAGLSAGAVWIAGILTHVVPCSGATWMISNLTFGGGLVLLGVGSLAAARQKPAEAAQAAGAQN